MENEILFSRHERNGAVYAELLLNRPEKGNALTMPMLERLKALAQELANDRTVRMVVIRGAGRFFARAETSKRGGLFRRVKWRRNGSFVVSLFWNPSQLCLNP